MGAITPALPKIGAIGGLASVGGTILQTQQQRKEAKKQKSLESERIAVQRQQSEKERKERAKRAVAAQKARFGASGISTSGSGSAVLSSLLKIADDQSESEKRLASIRQSVLGNTNSLSGRSLLDLGRVLTTVKDI